MSYTMEDFKRDLRKKVLQELSPEERQEIVESLPPEERLGGVSPDQIRKYLNQLTAGRPAEPRKARRKK
jgi:hypothetical protein